MENQSYVEIMHRRVYDEVKEAGEKYKTLTSREEIAKHLTDMEYTSFEEFEKETGLKAMEVFMGRDVRA